MVAAILALTAGAWDSGVDTAPPPPENTVDLSPASPERLEAHVLAEVVARDAQSATLRVVTDRLAPLLPGSPPDVPPVVSFPNPDTGAAARFEVRAATSMFPGTWTLLAQGEVDTFAWLTLTVGEGHVSGTVDGSTHAWRLDGDGDALTATVASDDGCADEDAPTLATCPPAPEDAERLDANVCLDDNALVLPPPLALLAGGAGPYAGFVDTIDVLAVYDPALLTWPNSGVTTVQQLNTQVVTAIVGAQIALATAGSTVTVRLIGVQPVTYPYVADLETNHSALRDESDGVADAAWALRETYGADIVLGVVPPDGVPVGNPSAGGISAIIVDPADPSNNDPYKHCITVASTSLFPSTRHELGHQLGLDHDYAGSPGCDDTQQFKYACGYSVTADPAPPGWQFTTPLAACSCAPGCPGCTPSPPGCAWVPPFTDIMSKNNTGFRQPFYSDPTLTWPAATDGNDGIPGTCDDWATTPAGTTVQLPPNDTSADAARRVRETAGVVAAYRQSVSNDLGATFLTPQPGALVASSTLFSWTPAGSEYLLEVGTLTANPFFSSGLLTATSISVSNLPTTTPLVARVWTNLGAPGTTAWWSYQEIRLNTEGRMFGCNADAAWLAPDPVAAAAPCNPAGGAGLCQVSPGGTLIWCSLFATGAGATGTAVAAPATMWRQYHAYIYGTNAGGQPFCCMSADFDGNVVAFELEGTSGPDTLALSTATHTLYNWHQGPTLVATVSARGGDDTVIGANTSTPAFTERLLGQAGDDELTGLAGHDLLVGAGGINTLRGGLDDDTLVGGANDVNWLYGELGHDTLCSPRRASHLFGADAPGTNELTRLYVASTATGTWGVMLPNTTAAQCGHTTHGTAWAACTSYPYTAAPGLCADWMED